MIEKSLDEMIENTTDLMEDFLKTHVPTRWFEIHEDIEIMRIFLDSSQKSDYEPGEHELITVMETLARCRQVLEYGDRLITKTAMEPIYCDHGLLFGVN